jgi:hypothetical protein
MQFGVRGDPALAVYDLVDPPGRDVHRLGQPVLTHAQRREELLKQDLPLVLAYCRGCNRSARRSRRAG